MALNPDFLIFNVDRLSQRCRARAALEWIALEWIVLTGEQLYRTLLNVLCSTAPRGLVRFMQVFCDFSIKIDHMAVCQAVVNVPAGFPIFD